MFHSCKFLVYMVNLNLLIYFKLSYGNIFLLMTFFPWQNLQLNKKVTLENKKVCQNYNFNKNIFYFFLNLSNNVKQKDTSPNAYIQWPACKAESFTPPKKLFPLEADLIVFMNIMCASNVSLCYHSFE